MATVLKQELKVFYCYAREDQRFREQLEQHMSNLKRRYNLKTWFDREILPGENWEIVIEEKLNKADLILLLVSADFMASDYCYNKEMRHALDRHVSGEAKVIPILLRRVDWTDAPFSHIQILPTDALPIARWADLDEAFYNVVVGIEQVIKGLLASRKAEEAERARLAEEEQRRRAKEAEQVGAERPHILLFERDQQVAGLFSGELARIGYKVRTVRSSAVEVFDAIARFPIRLVLVNQAQASAGRLEFWRALDIQRRNRGCQVLTFRCANLGGYGSQDTDGYTQVSSVLTDIEIEGLGGVGKLVSAVRARLA